MKEIIDLTYTIEEGMTSFNAYWHPLIEITQIGRIPFEGRETRRLSFGTHTGTHIDAPLHFIAESKGIDQIPLSLLLGEVSILDFSHLGENDSITAEMLAKYDLKERVLIKFGWGKYWGTRKFYTDYPYFSTDAAEHLVNAGVRVLAMDTPSPDDSRIKLEKGLLGSEADSPIHKILLGNEVFLVEYVANLDAVTDFENWNLSVMPIKVKGSDGCPARVCIFK